jgi:hypothetical protein
MKTFFLATLLFLFKNGAALIFANFLGIFCQQGMAAEAEIVEIVSTPADLRHCSRLKQPSYY